MLDGANPPFKQNGGFSRQSSEFVRQMGLVSESHFQSQSGPISWSRLDQRDGGRPQASCAGELFGT